MANAGVTVGSVWLDVLPSMRNFGSELVSQTESASRQAGERSGEALGEGTESGFRGRMAGVVAAGAAIGVAVGAAITQALDIQAAQAKLGAQLGLTAQDSERYGRIAGQVYAGAYGDSLDQVNEAIRGVHQNISDNLSDADLQSITQGVLNLASAFGVDVGGATAAVGQMLRTGLAPDAATALNVVTAGFQNGVDKAGDFLDTLNEYGTQFRKLGLDGATATGLLSQGLQAGARDADIVADAIKEFSIRAVDGSKTTAEGFAMVGLNADQMAAQIAKGGPAAEAGLDTVLDRLRAMPDPVLQSRAAVALFGTQAEDLGQALFALDPTTAVNALGQVGTAAAGLDQALGDTAQAKLTSFMRTLQLVFVEVLGNYVVPIITVVATVLSATLGPALSLLGSFITGTVVPAFQGFGQWLQQSQGWLIPLAAGIGAFVLVLNAATIATTLWGVATSAASAIMGIVRGAVLSFQVAMWLLNAAMAANPIGIVVAVLAGLVAAVVVAWNTSETFRSVVMGAWQGIQAAAGAAWSFLQGVFGWLGSAASTVAGVFVAAWGGVVAAFNAVAAAASWLWGTVLSPVFSAIGLAARVLVAVIVTVLVAPWLIAFNLLSAAATWLWQNAIQPAFAGIQAVVGAVWSWLQANVFAPAGVALGLLGSLFGSFAGQASSAWQTVQAALAVAWSVIDSVVFAPIRAGLALIGVAMGLFRDAAVSAWNTVQAGLLLVWNFINVTVIQPLTTALQVALLVAMGAFRDGARLAWEAVQAALAAVWGWLQTNVFQPIIDFLGPRFSAAFNTYRDIAIAAWSAVRDAVNVVWVFIRDNIWQPMVNFVTRDIPNAFQTAKDAVGRVWDGLREVFAAPIRFVVDVVYNKGIVPAWNWIAGLVSLPPLQTVSLGFARGGRVPGNGESDSVPAMLTPGEYVFSKSAVRAMGGVDMLERWHQAARTGRNTSRGLSTEYIMWGGDASEPGLAYFADGGQVEAALAYARAQNGKPYQWAGVGNPSFDCSGFMSAITCVLLGRPVARLFSTGSFGPGRGAAGFQPGTGSQFVIGVRNGNPGHMAGNLAGTPVESNGRGVTVGSGSSPMSFPMQFFLPQVGGQFVDAGGGGFFDPAAWVKQLFAKAIDSLANLAGDTEWAQMGAALAKRSVDGAVDWFINWATDNISRIISLVLPFDTGGFLPTGWSTVYNGTGRPEPVLTDAQWQAMAEGGAGSDGAAMDARLTELIDAVKAQPPTAIHVEDRSGNPIETARATQLALRLAR